MTDDAHRLFLVLQGRLYVFPYKSLSGLSPFLNQVLFHYGVVGVLILICVKFVGGLSSSEVCPFIVKIASY